MDSQQGLFNDGGDRISEETASELRERAGEARRNGNGTQDALCWRLVCESPYASGLDWLQYGHALKELGFLHSAEQAYRTAAASRPDDGEIALQTGKLLRRDGQIEEALAELQRASGTEGADQNQVEKELGEIEFERDNRLGQPREAGEDDLHVYLSAPSGLFRESDAGALAGLGLSDYSYSFVMKGFIWGLEKLEIPFSVIQYPEWFPDIRKQSSAKRNVHLSFSPPERLRLLKGAYNVVCFAWEFERLRLQSELNSYHAFSDQIKMLDLADEMWVLSTFGVDIVGRSLRKPVRHVPSPVPVRQKPSIRHVSSRAREIEASAKELRRIRWEPVAVLPRLQAEMNAMAARRLTSVRSALGRRRGGRGKTFLTVASVHDFRKQLRPMLEGFAELLTSHPDATLFVKLTTPHAGVLPLNTLLLNEQMSDPSLLIPPLVSERILLTVDRLTREEMGHLYTVADFYVCTSFGEGQNLPMLEAMAVGVVPVSVAVTAMSDYINPDNAVLIETRKEAASPRLTARYQMFGFSIDAVSSRSVSSALSRAIELAPEDYELRSARAADIVRADFGPEKLAGALERITGARREELSS